MIYFPLLIFLFFVINSGFQAINVHSEPKRYKCYEWIKSIANFTTREVKALTPVFNRTKGLLKGESGGPHALPDTTILPPVLSDAQIAGTAILNDQWTYTSSEGQDKLVVKILNGKRNGYFIDVGARYWNKGSNSFSLEYYYNWKGLCIEPDEDFFTGLVMNRTCTVICNNPITSKSGNIVLFNYQIQGYPRVNSNGTNKFTVTLRDIFTRFAIPTIVDYLSLDIEGHESRAMLAVDLSKYTFLMISVERPPKQLHHRLVSYGYYWLTQLGGNFGEMIYIHNSIPNFTTIMNTYRPFASSSFRQSNYPYFKEPKWPPITM